MFPLTAAQLALVVQAETQGLKAYADEVAAFGPLTAYSSGIELPTDGAMLDPAQVVTEADIAGLLSFFDECGITPKIQTLGHVLPASLAILARAGFGLEYVLHLYTHDLQDVAAGPTGPVTEQAADRTKWAEVAAQAFGEGSAAIMRVNAMRQDLECWWALVDGQPAGVGALTVDGAGVASLFSAATLPHCRAQGVQSALLHARLRSAQAQGASLATVFVAPGTGSERNVARAGFRLSGTRLSFGLS